MIIELIGAPGTGKTTFYKHLCQSWDPECTWVYRELLLRPPKPSFNKPYHWMEYTVKQVLKKKLRRDIPAEYGIKYIHNNHRLAVFLHQCVSGYGFSESPDQTGSGFRAYQLLFRDFCTYQAIAERNSAFPCIVNEGLLQKSFLIHEDREIMDRQLDEYLSLFQLPKAIIWVDFENTDVILSRLKKRDKTIVAHIGKHDRELMSNIGLWRQMIQLMIEKAKKLNVPVFRINGENDVNENVQLMLQNLSNLP